MRDHDLTAGAMAQAHALPRPARCSAGRTSISAADDAGERIVAGARGARSPSTSPCLAHTARRSATELKHAGLVQRDARAGRSLRERS